MRVKTAVIIGAAVLAMTGTALAGPWGAGRGGGWGGAQGAPVNIEAVKKFQNETATLRNEMMLKKVELRNEYLKQPIDDGKVTTMTKELTDLQTKIAAIATANGLPAAGGGCGMGGGMGMGKGRGMMRTAYQAR